jgi:hypothetical protein
VSEKQKAARPPGRVTIRVGPDWLWLRAMHIAWKTGDLGPLAKMFGSHEPGAKECRQLAKLFDDGKFQKKPGSQQKALREPHIESLRKQVNRLQAGELQIVEQNELGKIVTPRLYRKLGIKRDSDGRMSRKDAISAIADLHGIKRKTLENAVLDKRGSARRWKKGST